jgi:hypothetical protein
MSDEDASWGKAEDDREARFFRDRMQGSIYIIVLAVGFFKRRSLKNGPVLIILKTRSCFTKGIPFITLQKMVLVSTTTNGHFSQYW